jgi:hypothetical protein
MALTSLNIIDINGGNMKKLIMSSIILLFSSLCVAETCPSVDTIKRDSLKGWKMYDSDDNTLVSAERLSHFKANIEQFILAEWEDENNKNNTVHCYYRDKDGSNLNAYLAKNNFRPDIAQKYWYKVTGSMQCTAGMDKCQFQPQALR